jgi:ABC-2 type transport system permease protein
VADISVYRRLVAAQIRGHASYRSSFVLDLAANGLIPVIDLAGLLAMFRVTRTLGGFTAAEVVVMYGLAAVAFAIADLAVGNIEKLRDYVRRGLLDAVLVRPLSVLGQLLALDFTIRRVTRIGVAVTVLGLALHRAGVVWSPSAVALLALALISGVAFFASVFVAGATVAFWWIDSGEFANAFTYGGREFTFYPITVYNGFFRHFFALGLGFGFVAYFPALGLLGRTDPLGLPGWLEWVSPGVAVAALIVAGLMWRVGVRHYRSTGS